MLPLTNVEGLSSFAQSHLVRHPSSAFGRSKKYALTVYSHILQVGVSRPGNPVPATYRDAQDRSVNRMEFPRGRWLCPEPKHRRRCARLLVVGFVKDSRNLRSDFSAPRSRSVDDTPNPHPQGLRLDG